MTSPADYPQPRDFAGDGLRVRFKVDHGLSNAPLDTSKAERTPRRLLSRRIVQDGERRYTAYSADELIEIDSLAHHGRPGQLY